MSRFNLNSRRVRLLRIGGHMMGEVLGLFQQHAGVRFETDLPKDAWFVRWFFDPVTDCIVYVVASEEFDEIPEGGVPPTHDGLKMVVHAPPLPLSEHEELVELMSTVRHAVVRGRQLDPHEPLWQKLNELTRGLPELPKQ